MKKNLKVPKSSNDKILSNDVEATLIGVLVLLVSLIGLLGKGPVGEFLQFCIVFIFGNFYFLVYAYLIFFSSYLILTKKMYVMKLNIYLLAFILILFSFLIGASTSNVELTISNFTSTYINVLERTPGIDFFSVSSLEAISYTGGGYLGYMLTGFFNTCFTPVGTSIAIALFAFVGISVFLKDIISFLLKTFNQVKKLKEVAKEKKKVNKNIEIDINEEKKDTSLSNNENSNNQNINFNKIVSFENKKNVNEENKIVNEELIKEETERPKMDLFVKNINQEESSFKETLVNSNIFKNDDQVNQLKKLNEDINDDLNIEKTNTFQSSTIVDPFSNYDQIEKKVTVSNQVEDSGYIKNKLLNQTSENGTYQLPPISILSNYQNDDVSYENKIIAEKRLMKINEVFNQFNIGASAISYTIGPSCTRFNIKMNPGVKVNTLTTIQNEIAINLGGNKTVRLELVVEGRDTSSIEIGNAKISSVSYKECLQEIINKNVDKDKLLIPLGKGIEGNVVTICLDELPHLLVAGTTGSGKSVFINTVITTLLMRNRPDELKLMLIDPKKVEFSKYNQLPHLLCPVITEAIEGKNALKKLVEEMERRYSLFLTNGKGCAKLSEYNEMSEKYHYDKLPNIVMICDEFSDFMSEYGKEIEPLIKRLAQKARACGIYLIICTQRPSVNVITGDIKAVIPSRISLLVPQAVDSRIILDEGGAESLLGNGDMLARIPHHNSLVRVQGAFIKNSEIIEICDYIKSQKEVDYDKNFASLVEPDDLGIVGEYPKKIKREKDQFHEAVKRHVIETRIASTSNLISYFGFGYGRADHILNCLEEEGVIKRAPNSNRRIVVMTMEDYLASQNNEEKE